AEYFIDPAPDPFMQQVYPVREDKRHIVPAITHVDGSGRLQTVNEAQNPLYYRLIREFANITGVPMLLNTSFNENEPIVDTPAQAVACFLRTQMDAIVVGNTIVTRSSSSVMNELESRRTHPLPLGEGRVRVSIPTSSLFNP